jgi:hypothetical protein
VRSSATGADGIDHLRCAGMVGVKAIRRWLRGSLYTGPGAAIAYVVIYPVIAISTHAAGAGLGSSLLYALAASVLVNVLAELGVWYRGRRVDRVSSTHPRRRPTS